MSLLVIYFIYSNMYMLTLVYPPPLPLSPLVTINLFLCLWGCLCFIYKFTFFFFFFDSTYKWYQFPCGSDSKESVSNAGDPGLIPGSEGFPGEGNGIHSSILAWRILWTEEPSGL